jgi:hypothetical protein
MERIVLVEFPVIAFLICLVPEMPDFGRLVAIWSHVVWLYAPRLHNRGPVRKDILRHLNSFLIHYHDMRIPIDNSVSSKLCVQNTFPKRKQFVIALRETLQT